MGTTSTYHLPYPELTDVANVPADMRELAEATDAVMGGGSPFCEANANATQSFTTSSQVPVVFQSAYQSQAGMWTSGGGITIPVAGLYVVSVGFSWAANATGSRIVLLTVNGATNRSWNIPVGAGPISGTVMRILNLAVGTVVGCSQYQSTGAALLSTNQAYPSLTVARLGPGGVI